MIPYLIFLKKERVYFVRNKIIFSLVFLAGLFFISLLAPKIIMALRTRSIIVEINEKNCPYSKYIDINQLKSEQLIVRDSQKDIFLFCTLRDKQASLVKINTELAETISEISGRAKVKEVRLDNYQTLLSKAVPYLIGDKTTSNPQQLRKLVTFLQILDNDAKNQRAYWRLFWDQMTLTNENRHLVPEYQPNYN